MFHGNEIGTILLDPEFLPRKLDWYWQIYKCILKPDFLKLRNSYQNFLATLRFSDTPWDLKAKLWVHELTAQTMSLAVKPSELKGVRQTSL